MKKLFILIALFVSVQSFAQIETDTHVFWQPGAKLTFDMFQGAAPDSFRFQFILYTKRYGSLFRTGIWNLMPS